MVDYSVLIIDDDIWMQRILAKTLQSYGFKNVLLASNGFEGIDLAVANHPELIIMDILMPELTGHLTLKILKSVKMTKDIPVIMVSALSDTENLGLAVKMGTAGFISKPFTRATVYDKLISVFGRDRLEKISRGEPIDDKFDALKTSISPLEEKVFIPLDSFANLNASDTFGITDTTTDIDEYNNSQMQQNVLKSYQEDEKRSIESIKKLLQKSRK